VFFIHNRNCAIAQDHIRDYLIVGVVVVFCQAFPKRERAEFACGNIARPCHDEFLAFFQQYVQAVHQRVRCTVDLPVERAPLDEFILHFFELAVFLFVPV
jgi:hypothetical protein